MAGDEQDRPGALTAAPARPTAPARAPPGRPPASARRTLPGEPLADRGPCALGGLAQPLGVGQQLVDALAEALDVAGRDQQEAPAGRGDLLRAGLAAAADRRHPGGHRLDIGRPEGLLGGGHHEHARAARLRQRVARVRAGRGSPRGRRPPAAPRAPRARAARGRRRRSSSAAWDGAARSTASARSTSAWRLRATRWATVTSVGGPGPATGGVAGVGRGAAARRWAAPRRGGPPRVAPRPVSRASSAIPRLLASTSCAAPRPRATARAPRGPRQAVYRTSAPCSETISGVRGPARRTASPAGTALWAWISS